MTLASLTVPTWHGRCSLTFERVPQLEMEPRGVLHLRRVELEAPLVTVAVVVVLGQGDVVDL